MITLTPAYNRDYKNKKQVETDFNNNKDFIINDMFSVYNGKACNKSDLYNLGYKDKYKSVKIRYNKLQKIIIIRI